MKRKPIKYIGFYDSNAYANEKRNSFISATNKMDYIAQAIASSGREVNIISPSWTTNKSGFYHGRTSKLSSGITLTCGSTFGANCRINRYFRILWSWVWLLFYLLKNTQTREQVVVYHSMMLIWPIFLAKKIRKLELILEVEEIYQDVQAYSRNMNRNEFRIFKLADKFIFSTELLNELLNKSLKPYVVIYGTYKVEKDIWQEFENEKINVVYAGTFDPSKGCIIAAETAMYLSKNYHIHIIGFGSADETNNMLNAVSKISKQTDATISYDGLLKGDEYTRLLQKCDIGLCTQSADALYNGTSFPSKILSYLANGLRVISVRIRSVECSEVGNHVIFYDEQKPESIAKLIMSINLNEPYDSRAIICELNLKFINNIRKLLDY